MKKNKTKLLVILGAICILLVAVSSWYTITFNEARFIVPMDISTYTFRLKDLLCAVPCRSADTGYSRQ